MIHTFFTPEEAADIKRDYLIKAQALGIEIQRHCVQFLPQDRDRDYLNILRLRYSQAINICNKVAAGIVENREKPKQGGAHDSN